MTSPDLHRIRENRFSDSDQAEGSDGFVGAPASLVNRTHRIVRERARTQSDRRTRLRSLGFPLVISFALLIILSAGVWTALVQSDLSPAGIPDASDPMLVFLLWFFPVSAALLATVWFKRANKLSGGESTR